MTFRDRRASQAWPAGGGCRRRAGQVVPTPTLPPAPPHAHPGRIRAVIVATGGWMTRPMTDMVTGPAGIQLS